MKAPEIDVTLSTGEVKPLRSLYEQERLALVFLRHFGCTFCREHVRELRRLPELNIAFVTLGTPEQAEDFRLNMGSPHVFISDPEKKLHGMFNLERGGLTQILEPGISQGAVDGAEEERGVVLVDEHRKASVGTGSRLPFLQLLIAWAYTSDILRLVAYYCPARQVRAPSAWQSPFRTRSS